jgi:hypothetical protein
MFYNHLGFLIVLCFPLHIPKTKQLFKIGHQCRQNFQAACLYLASSVFFPQIMYEVFVNIELEPYR